MGKRMNEPMRCNLLKIDIEGSEMRFLETEQKFLDLVDSIILEWHKWRVQLPELEAFLNKRAFKLARIFEEDETMGTCFFSRSATYQGFSIVPSLRFSFFGARRARSNWPSN